MAKTANLTLRIDPALKADVESLYSQFGITITDAVNIFFHQSLMSGGLPFDMKRPPLSQASLAALQEAEDIISGKLAAKRYDSVKEMVEDIEREC